MAALQERLIASVRDQQKPRKNDNKVIADGKEYDLSQELPEELKRRHIFDFEGGYRAIIFRFESKEDNAAKNVLGVLLHNHGGNDMKEAFVKVRKLLGVTRKPDKRRFGNAAVIELYWEMPDGQLLPS